MQKGGFSLSAGAGETKGGEGGLMVGGGGGAGGWSGAKTDCSFTVSKQYGI